MRKVKIAYWAVILVLLLLFFVQNQEFFMTKKSLSWNIISIPSLAALEWKWFFDYKTPEFQLILFFLVYFFAGVILTFIYCFFNQMKYNRTIRFLNRTCESHENKISELEREMETYRKSSPDIDAGIINMGDREEADFSEKARLREK
ncbi:MAG: hypothetical protein BWK80_23345 [Desulfobacteraceae bacterium IS3]|nr:MAG: hypothetical protein BWK80_23345 [Desulfobacteraceae bacterium IS3]